MKRLAVLLFATAACTPDHGAPRRIVAVPPTTTSTAAPPTTVGPPPAVVRASRAAVRPRPLPQRGARAAASSDLLDALAQCESGGNAAEGGTYRGAFQWSQRSWDSHVARMGRPELVGVDPASLTYEVQKQVTAAVPVSTWGEQFPACSRRVGVR